MIKKDFIKILLFSLVVCFIIVTCKEKDKKSNYYKLDTFDSVYLSVIFSDKIKINSKNLLIINDTTDDVIDATTDIIDEDKYIFKKEDIDKYRNYESLLYNDIFENLKNNQNINNIKKLESDSDLTNSLVISIVVGEYNVGEYNLIKNIPTTVKFIVKILKKDMQMNDILLLNRKYKAKSEIEYATEKLRIKNISDQLSKDVLKILGLG